MRQLSYVFLCVALLLAGFAYWGIFTSAGRTRFDEMDGIYPWLAGAASLLLFLSALIIWVIAKPAS